MGKFVKIALAIIALAALLSAPALAEEKKDYFKKLKSKPSSSSNTTARKGVVTTAVGGVRASRPVDDIPGADGNPVVPSEEQDKYNDALLLCKEGKNDDAIKAFEAFLAAYPNSQLKPDAQKALDDLKSAKATPAPNPNEGDPRADMIMEMQKSK